MGFRVTTIHAFIAVDKNGDEGVPAIRLGDAWYPLLAADERRLAEVKEWARELAHNSGQEFRLVRFTVREELETIRS